MYNSLKSIIEFISSNSIQPKDFLSLGSAYIKSRILKRRFDECLPNKDIIIQPKHLGVKFVINKYNNNIYELNPKVEEHLRSYFREVINAGDICFDIGANIGIHTLFLAKLGGKVISIEPNQTVFNTLIKNIEINNFTNIIPLNIAVSDSVNKKKFYQSIKLNLVSTLEESHIKSYTNLIDDFKVIEIQTKPLDLIVRELGLENKSIKLIKIDVEGHEISVLKGGFNTLKNTNHVIIETTPKTDKIVRKMLEENNFKLLTKYENKYENHGLIVWYDNIYTKC